MADASRRILVFSLTFLLFFVILPVGFGTTLGFFPLVQKADLIEFLGPFFIVPAYWYLFEGAGRSAPSRAEILVFSLFTVLLATSDGIHLASNSIQHLIEDSKGTPGYQLAYFLHKPFSHYGLSAALVGLATCVVHREWKYPANLPHSWIFEFAAAIFYGFAFFAFTISGKVTALGIPCCVALSLFILFSWKKLRTRPMLVFWGMAHFVALVLCIVWGIYWKGLPNFDEVGALSQQRPSVRDAVRVAVAGLRS